MKKFFLIFLSILFFLCKKEEPEVIVKVIKVNAFSVQLAFEIINFDYVDSVIIIRFQEPYLPLKFSYKGLISVFKDTLVSPDFLYTYLIRVKGSSIKEVSLKVKTAEPQDYILFSEPLYLETDGEFFSSLKIYNISSIFGISGRILFNSSILKVDSIKKGNIWDYDDLFFSIVKKDTIFFALTKKRGETSFSGSGTALRVYYSKNSSGNLILKPYKIVITDEKGSLIPSPQVKTSKVIVR